MESAPITVPSDLVSCLVCGLASGLASYLVWSARVWSVESPLNKNSLCNEWGQTQTSHKGQIDLRQLFCLDSTLLLHECVRQYANTGNEFVGRET